MLLFVASVVRLALSVCISGVPRGVVGFKSPRNSEVLSKLSRIPSSVECTSVTTQSEYEFHSFANWVEPLTRELPPPRVTRHTFCDRFLKRLLMTVSWSFMNVSNSVLWRMAIILKANKVNLFVSSVLFVFWYHSPNVLDTPRMYIE
jgi:hypothetical protein